MRGRTDKRAERETEKRGAGEGGKEKKKRRETEKRTKKREEREDEGERRGKGFGVLSLLYYQRIRSIIVCSDTPAARREGRCCRCNATATDKTRGNCDRVWIERELHLTRIDENGLQNEIT